MSPVETAEPIEIHAVWGAELGGPKEPCIRWGPDPPGGKQFVRQSDLLKKHWESLFIGWPPFLNPIGS